MSASVWGALIGALIGISIVLLWALWPVVIDIIHHGWRNDR